jgi:dihydroorotate dehydrogenase
MYQILKSILFLLSPEKAHHFTMKLLLFGAKTAPIRWIFQQIFQDNRPELAREVMGLRFPNVVGLAAGFDKDGKYIEAMAMLGFGFIEVGTVTPLPQKGNPKPRLFRLPKDRALINRMGFNNEGLDALVKRLSKWRAAGSPGGVILGGNIGKNKGTPNEKAADDYMICFEKLFPFVDYFVVNVSSPNTPNLRELQDKKPLTELLERLQKINLEQQKSKPILLKIAPDLTESQLLDIVEIVHITKISGIVATNTTIDRSNLLTEKTEIENMGAGGLSGRPLTQRSGEVVRFLRKNLNENVVIIGVGGIDKAVDGVTRIQDGADLIQIYTSFIFEGPKIIRQILSKLKC